jgi:NADPH2:quinone reductase
MRAQIIRRHGDPDVFELTDALAPPRPGPGQVLIAQCATSINPVDCKLRRGGGPVCPELPAVLGADIAGRVVALGPGVTELAPGDEVYGCGGGVRGMGGAYAELVLTDQRLVARRPQRLDLRAAAALPLVTITAWEGLYLRAGVKAGDRVLVHGGAGGVGHVAIQLAKARGAEVFTTVSGPEKAALARSLGADATIDYRAQDVADYVAEHTGGQGFDLVFDASGGSDLEASFAAARLNGQVVTIVARYSADLSLMHARGLSLHVVFMLIPMLHDLGRAVHGDILRAAAALVDAGKLTPLIDPTRFDLAALAEAHRRLEGGQALGKLVVDIGAA